MKIIIVKALVIAIALGILFSIFVNIVMASTIQRDYVAGTQVVLTGIDAVRDIIKTTGLNSFFRLCIGQFILYFPAIFMGCIWLGFWCRNDGRKNKT